MISEPLSHVRLLADQLTVLHIEKEKFHSTIVWFTKVKKKKVMQGFRGIGEICNVFFLFFKEITCRLRYALGMRQLRHWAPFLFVLTAMETIC